MDVSALTFMMMMIITQSYLQKQELESGTTRIFFKKQKSHYWIMQSCTTYVKEQISNEC